MLICTPFGKGPHCKNPPESGLTSIIFRRTTMNDKVTFGHVARKRFGQNFLQDATVINNIVNAINPQKDDFILEIGPGLGALTEPVAERVTRLNCIELDRDLAERLRHTPFLSDRLNIIETDALKFDFRSLATPENPVRVFGNLPYNISTPLLIHLFSQSEVIRDMHFMLQKEVVERLAAAPNSKDYGRLSVITQFYCRVIPIMEVRPTAFRPAPKVTSAVVRLVPYRERPCNVRSIAALEKVLAVAFNQRRKTVHNSLAPLFDDTQLEASGISLTSRAENLSLRDYCTLADLLEE